MLSLNYREELPEPVARELDQLIVKIKAFLLEEHNEDGTHRDEVEATTSSGKIITYSPNEVDGHRWRRGPWTFDETGNDSHIIGLRPVIYPGGTWNDFNPSGLNKAVIMELETSATMTITGIQNTERIKRRLTIGNRSNSGKNIILKHNNSGSALQYRMSLPASGDYCIFSGQYVTLWYDVGSIIWRIESAPEPVSCRAYLTSNQSIATGTWTKVTLNSESFDHPDNLFDSSTNYRFTAPFTSRYAVGASVTIDHGASTMGIRIVKNGSTVLAEHYSGIGTTNATSQTVTDIYQLAASDYIELFAYQGSGGNENVMGGAEYTHMAIHLVGGA